MTDVSTIGSALAILPHEPEEVAATTGNAPSHPHDHEVSLEYQALVRPHGGEDMAFARCGSSGLTASLVPGGDRLSG